LVETMWKTLPNEKPATRSVSSSSTLSGDHQTLWSETATSSAAAATVAPGRKSLR